MAQSELSDADVFGGAAPAPAAPPAQGNIPVAAPGALAAAGLTANSIPTEIVINKGVTPAAQEVNADVAGANQKDSQPEMGDADVFGSTAAAGPSGHPDFGLGLEKGLATPAANLETGIDWAAHQVPFLGDALDGGLKALTGQTIPEAVASFHQGMDQAAAQGRVPGKGGEVLGNVLGTLPAMALPGGVLAQGAANGALTSSAHDPFGVVRDAVVGSVLGKATEFGLNGILDTVAPKVSQAGQALIDAGMKDFLSPGQIFGKHSPQGILEAAGQGVPIVGEMLRKQGNDALIAANRAVADRVAGGFGGQAAGDTAEDLTRSVGAAKDAGYDIKTPSGTALDPIYANAVGGIRQQVQNIPDSTGIPARFDRLLQQEIVSRADPQTGVLSDDAVKSAKNAISAEVRQWGGDSSGWSKEYVGQLKNLRRALTDNLGRADPAAQAQLAGADANYPAYKTFQDAMRRGTQNSTNEPGWFTPQQLMSAVTRNATPEQVTEGSAPLQDLAKAMKANLPRKFKDVASPWHAIPEALVASGVAGSDILGGHGGALTAGMLAGIPMATKLGQGAVREALLKSAAGRAAVESQVGPLPRLLAAPSAAAGGLAGSAFGPALLPQAMPTR